MKQWENKHDNEIPNHRVRWIPIFNRVGYRTPQVSRRGSDHPWSQTFVGRFHNPGRVEHLVPFIFIRMKSLHNIKSCPTCPPQTLESLCLRQAWFWAFRCFFHRKSFLKLQLINMFVVTACEHTNQYICAKMQWEYDIQPTCLRRHYMLWIWRVFIATTQNAQHAMYSLQRQQKANPNVQCKHHKDAKWKSIHVEYCSQTNVSHAHTWPSWRMKVAWRPLSKSYQRHESFQISQIFREIHPGVQLIDWMNRGAPTNEIVLPVIKLLSDWSVLHASTNHMPTIHTPGWFSGRCWLQNPRPCCANQTHNKRGMGLPICACKTQPHTHTTFG